MYTVGFINVLAVLFAYLAKYKKFEDGLKISFILIFFFLALRFNFGNDYKSYLEGFVNINRYSTFDLFDEKNHFEPGWIFLIRLFSPLGFFAMTAGLALFNCFIYYTFIKKYVPVEFYWLAVFLYVFNPDIMLVHSSAMRQGLAIALFILSIDYLYKKDFIRYVVCVLVACLFHGSAFILMPLFLLGLFNWRISKKVGIMIFSLFVTLFLIGKSLQLEINEFLNVYFEKYTIYQGGVEIGSGLGILFLSMLLVFVLYYERYQVQENSLLFKIAILSFIFIPLGLIIMMIARVAMYFHPVTIAVFPLVISSIKEPWFKFFFALFLVLFTLYTFYQFFQSEVWRDAFGTYQTIFSAPGIY